MIQFECGWVDRSGVFRRLRGVLMERVYIDTSLVSRLSDQLRGNPLAISEDEAAAILAICSSQVELVTSMKMLEEVLRSANIRQRALLTLIATLSAKVPFQDMIHVTLGSPGSFALGRTHLGGGVLYIDPLILQLREIFDFDDTEHIFQAVRNGCTYFLTLDNSTIVARAKKHAERLEILCPQLRFVLPEELEVLLAS